jgi:hypothetical protein
MPSLIGNKPNQVSTNGDLGTLAFQDASNPAVGNLTFTGTGNRITGDFSNATVANRVAFQSTSAGTEVSAITFAATGQTQFSAHNASDATNANKATLICNTVEASLRSNINGTAAYLPLTMWTGGSESLRLSATSKAVILAGGSTSANGTGVTFPATQNASSDANTLDDYEEGTWTPALSGSGGSSGITYTSRSGSYVKVGRQVTCKGSIVLSGKTSITGAVIITGFPFNTENVDSTTPITYGYFANLGANTWTQVAGYMSQNAAQCFLGGKATSATTFTNFADADITATTRIDFVSIYFV